MRVHIFKLLVSHYLCFILWLVESRRFANRCRHCWCGNALLVPFGAVLLHIMTNGHLFVVIIMSSSCLPSCSSDLSFLSLAGLTHLTILFEFKSPKQGSCLRSRRTGLWRLGLFAEVRLWRQYPLVEEIIYIDMLKSCTFWWHLWFRTLDVSFSFCWV